MYCIGHIQNSGIFRILLIKVHSSIFKQIKHLLEHTYTKYIHTYWGIVKAYSDMFITLNNSFILATDTATRGVLWKKLFLEISQNSQDITCARISFLIKLQTESLDECFCNYFHNKAPSQMFSRVLKMHLLSVQLIY